MLVDRLFTYPIKGLTAIEHTTHVVKSGFGFPGDRAMALAYEDAPVTQDQRRVDWLPKNQLMVQNDWPGMAALETQFDPSSHVLTIRLHKKLMLQANIDSESGYAEADRFFSDYLQTLTATKAARHPTKTPVRLIGVPNQETRFPDRDKYDISILNQASCEALSTLLGEQVDIRRFRGNIIVKDLPAWQEMSLAGRTISTKHVKLRIESPITRCTNIDVHPERGVLEHAVLAALARSPGKGKFGMMATVIQDGEIAAGDVFELD